MKRVLLAATRFIVKAWMRGLELEGRTHGTWVPEADGHVYWRSDL